MPRYQRKVITHIPATRALREFGLNWFGDPRYRVVRADSRLETRGHELLPKYLRFGNQWILERYIPPEKFGDPSMWDANGMRFPFDGEYECVQQLGNDAERLLSETELRRLAEACQRTEELSAFARESIRKQEEEDKKKERKRMLDDMIADARPLRGGDAERKYAEELEEAAKNRQPTTAPNGASLSV